MSQNRNGTGVPTKTPRPQPAITNSHSRSENAGGMSPTGPAPWTLPRQRTPQAERTNHRQAELNTARSTARQEAQERRRRVLAHPDLAAALRELSYGGYPEPEMWNGYVPPKVDGYGRVNNSPRRDDLVAICAEAMRREKVAA